MIHRPRPGRLAQVVLAVMAVHTLWIALFLAGGREPRDLIHIGLYWVNQSQASTAITVDPTYTYPASRGVETDVPRGYDGQFAYFIALDPRNAHHYMDAPAYRYSRILYPAVAWALAAGRDDLLPYAMIVVNWLAVALGTLAVAVLLRRRGASPWWAAAFGLSPGMLLAVQRDLTEPLAYGLAAAGLLALAGRGRRRHLVAGAAFGLAALARQTTVVIPLVWSLWMLTGWDGEEVPVRDRLRRAVTVAGLAVIPYGLWTAILDAWLEDPGHPEPYVLVPFGWLFEKPFDLLRQPPMAIAVVLPAVVWCGVAGWALARGARRPELACLVVSTLVFVVFAPAYNAYTSAGRAALGVALMALLAAPFLVDVPRSVRHALVAAAVVYLAMAPVVFVYGLTEFRVL